jgi:hypothetical protein
MGVGSAVSSTGGLNVAVLRGSVTSLCGRWLAHPIKPATEADATGGTLSAAGDAVVEGVLPPPPPPPPQAETTIAAATATNAFPNTCLLDFMFAS